WAPAAYCRATAGPPHPPGRRPRPRPGASTTARPAKPESWSMAFRSKSASPPATAGSVPAALEAAAHDPQALLPAFAEDMAALPGELGDLGRLLQSASQGQDWARCARLLRQFLDKYLREFAR